ncbi:hypothetical protein AA14337_2891 [Acetobacter malorum DSM 14337]|uniref:Uncharacterized protein n=1 Tax=Acetobacter malorum DSM 14337 TaxID=1307910 RepID=A0ABQ0PYF1_9PROT|nr:hypothetical protein [Acetobacter malorum]KXV06804.1 hypothetical protein AD930_06815 [Acetobacter malorum]GBQ84699.1 hypothetical protein AA14337_2891 [Acetobacter malorum DSM 14337]
MDSSKIAPSVSPTQSLTDWRVAAGREGELPPEIGTQGKLTIDMDALKEGKLTAYVTRPGQPEGHSEVVQIELDAGSISISLATAGSPTFDASMRALPSGEVLLCSEIPGETYKINPNSGKLTKASDWEAPKLEEGPSPEDDVTPTP